MGRRARRAAAALALALGLGACSFTPVAPSPALPLVPGDVQSRTTLASFAGDRGELETAWTGDGTILVRPRLDGAEPGWCILDTGASGLTITSGAARRLGLETIGRTGITGHGPRTDTTVYEAETFALGPVTLARPVLAGVDIAFAWAMYGRDVAGILGYEAFAHAIVEIDPASRRVVLRRDDAGLGALPWQALRIRQRLPRVECRFAAPGAPSGWFLVDTGFEGSVWFNADAVRRHGLFDGQPTRRAEYVGVGGTRRVRRAALDWFELGATRFRVDAVFDEPAPGGADAPPHPRPIDHGALVDDEPLAGIIGMRLLRRCRVVLDYAGGRAAFLPIDDER